MTPKPDHKCIGCDTPLPGTYPFTLCDDCWDKKYPPPPEPVEALRPEEV